MSSSRSNQGLAAFTIGCTLLVTCYTAGAVVRMDEDVRTLVKRPTPTVTVTGPAETPSPVITGDPVTAVSWDEVLGKFLPYYHQPAPDWCVEDMTCWLGSAADGRSPAEVWESLEADVAASVEAYGTTTWDPPKVDERDWVCEDEGDKDCGSWITDVRDGDGAWHFGCMEYALPSNRLGTTCPDGYTDSN